MMIYLFRHGIAEDVGPQGDDASRRLTAEGVEKTRQAAAGLAQFAGAPQVILSSPKARALETAQLLGRQFDMEPQLLPALALEEPQTVLAKLHAREEKILLAVGHEPTLSQVAELLVSGNAAYWLDLGKAGCACVETQRLEGGRFARGELKWLVTSKILRACRR